MKTVAAFVIAALCEIAGCYAAWMWLRSGKSPLWLAAGLLPLVLFAVILTTVETSHAGRAYAAYGGVYIVSSLLWLWAAEGVRPSKFDVIGAAICLAGAAVIVLGARARH